MARPSKFTPELAVEICRRVADGRSLRSVCRDEDMPNADTVNEWRINRAEFSEQYARARERRAEVLADEITRSPSHTCGKEGTSPGYALRFPRLLQERADKAPEDATTEEEILRLHRLQRRRGR